jgi:hypothetical protein
VASVAAIAHRGLGEIDRRTAQAAGRFRHDIAAVDRKVRAEFLQRHDQQIHRPRADGAAARQRDFRLVHPRQERRDHPEAGAHPRHQVIRRRGVDDVGRRDVQGLALVFTVAGPLARRHDIDAVIAEDALQLRDVGEPRHVVEDQSFFRQQCGNHQRQRRVLRPRNRNGTMELAAADNTNAVHAKTPLLCTTIEGTYPPEKQGYLRRFDGVGPQHSRHSGARAKRERE